MGSWSARNLTLLGKIAILKSLVVSQIVYLLSSLPSPPGVIKEVNCLLYDFLWDSKGDKIKRTEMINEYNKGQGHPMDLFLKISVLQARFCWLGDVKEIIVLGRKVLLGKR